MNTVVSLGYTASFNGTADLVNFCCMVSPYGAAEKQVLLEAGTLETRAETLIGSSTGIGFISDAGIPSAATARSSFDTGSWTRMEACRAPTVSEISVRIVVAASSRVTVSVDSNSWSSRP